MPVVSGWVPEGPSQRPLLPPMELTKGGPGWAGAGDCGKGEGSRPIHTALSCRMDSFEDRLRQLREAFNTGRTRPAEFRAAQLQGLSRFLRDNKQQLQEALAQDLRKVRGAGTVGEGCVCPPPFPPPRSARVVQLGQGTQLSHILQEEELKAHGTPAPLMSHG